VREGFERADKDRTRSDAVRRLKCRVLVSRCPDVPVSWCPYIPPSLCPEYGAVSPSFNLHSRWFFVKLGLTLLSLATTAAQVAKNQHWHRRKRWVSDPAQVQKKGASHRGIGMLGCWDVRMFGYWDPGASSPSQSLVLSHHSITVAIVSGY